jgi:hypothetical protein
LVVVQPADLRSTAEFTRVSQPPNLATTFKFYCLTNRNVTIYLNKEGAMPRTKINPTSLEALEQVAECLRTLAHPHRQRIVEMLLQSNAASWTRRREVGACITTSPLTTGGEIFFAEHIVTSRRI